VYYDFRKKGVLHLSEVNKHRAKISVHNEKQFANSENGAYNIQVEHSI